MGMINDSWLRILGVEVRWELFVNFFNYFQETKLRLSKHHILPAHALN